MSSFFAAPIFVLELWQTALFERSVHSTYTMGKRAIVFGASGVTGWSFVNEILNDYPEKGIWVRYAILLLQ